MSEDLRRRGSRPYLAPDFLDLAACVRIQTAMDHGTAEPAEVFDSGVTVDLGARRAESIDIDPETLAFVEARLDAARDAVAAHYDLSLGAREGPGFLRYGPSGLYRPHRDRAADPAWPDGARRLVSMIVFLNSSRSRPAPDEFGGGELLLLPEPDEVGGSGVRTITPRRGWLVAFPAERIHEVRPVIGGIRDVIVDWYY